jgi:hypothetical protein
MRARSIAIVWLAALGACGKDNFGVSAPGCDAPPDAQRVFQCAVFEHKPWSYGLDEFSGFYVAAANAQPASAHLLRALSEAKARGRYVAIGGETPELLQAVLEDTQRAWEQTKPDLSGLLVQVHSEAKIEQTSKAALRSMRTEPKFYVLKKPAT